MTPTIPRTQTTPECVTDDFLAKCAEALAQHPDFAFMLHVPPMAQVWASGVYLKHALEAQGADDDETARVGFTHGQTCLGRDPWLVAEALLEAWGQDRAAVPNPGRELAEQLLGQAEADGDLERVQAEALACVPILAGSKQ